MLIVAEAVLDAPNGYLEPLFGCREPVSGLTHLLGFLVAAVGCSVLWSGSRGDRPKRISMAIYGASLMALYAASAAYHIVDVPAEQLAVFRRLDHASIFVLIAGTFTPFYVNATRGLWRSLNLILIWSCALVGIALKVLFIGMPDAASAGLYVGMGWLAMIGYAKLASVISHRAMAWALVGGVIYSVGAAVDVAQWPVPLPGVFGFHEVLHVLVMIASAIHFAVVMRYLVPLARPIARRAPVAVPVPSG